MFVRIDTWIIDKIFDPISHAVQRRWGKNCFWIAWFFTGLAIVGFMLDGAHYFGFVPNSRETSLSPLNIAIIFPLAIFILTTRLYDFQRMSQRQNPTARTLPSSRKPIACVMRTILMVLVLNMIADAIVSLNFLFLITRYGGVIAWCLADYFSACTPLPPGFERQKEPSVRNMTPVVE